MLERPTDTAADSQRFAATVFAVLWAISICFHVGSYGLWAESLWLGLAAVWLLAHPSSSARLLLLAATVGADVWLNLPDIPNHWLVHGLVAAAVLIGYGSLAWTRKTFAVDAASLHTAFAPAVRLSVLLLYFWVVWHKINHDYLLSPLSCGAEFYRKQRHIFPFLPAGHVFEMTSAYVTMIVEAAIPLLLVSARTWAWGVLLGVVFHVFIAFNPISGFYNFSAFLMALYALFVPDAFLERARAELHAMIRGIPAHLTRFAWWKLLGCFALGFGGVYALTYLTTVVGSRRTFLVLWLPYGLFMGWMALRFVRWFVAAPAQVTPGLRPAYALLWLVPAVTLLNGVMPYLGLKTENSFAMFSNLRTEGGVSNHLLLPAAQAFGYQRDLVEIVDGSLPWLTHLRDKGRLLPYFELQRGLALKQDPSLRYRRGDDDVTRTAADEQSPTERPPGYLLRKLLRFRPVQRSGEQACMH